MSLATPPAVKTAALHLLRSNVHFRRYWLARVISMFGDRLYFLALPWLVLTITDGNVFYTSITLALEYIPVIILFPFLGTLLDTYERKQFMLLADWVRGIVMGLLSLLLFFGSLEVYHVFVAAFIMSFCTELFDTSSQSYLPSIVQKDDLLEANSNIASVQSLLATVGHLISGLVIILLTVGGSIAINSITFFVSALLLLTLPKAPGNNVKRNLSEKWIHLKEGFQYLFSHEVLFPLAMFSAAMNLAISSSTALIVFGAKEIIQLSAAQTSIIFVVGGVCSFTATLLVRRYGKRLNKGQLIRFGSIGVFLGLFSLWIDSSLLNFAVGFAMLVSIAVFVGVSVTTYRQEVVPSELLGRVTGSYLMITFTASAIGIMGGGLLAQQTSMSTVFLVAMTIVALNVLIAWFGKIKHVK